ncbi:MAG TPA: GGDEF domain-containing protein, partial [Polyangiaceae bacterium]|nr:GGDEF domain-containing protein [Polyangiaceae bacterium]
CPVRVLTKGEALLRSGQANETMYMLLSGRLSVHLDSAESEPVAFLDAGQTVGEMSVIDESPASAHVLAAETSRLLAIDEQTFWRLVEASHEFAVNLLLLLARRMRESNTSLAESARLKRQFEREATVDGLTGLRNRRFFDGMLSRLYERNRRDGTPLSLLVIDVDHFKKFNDSYGHAAGDDVLKVVAKTLGSCLRPTDQPARYGGEEFVVLLPATKLEGATVAAERLRKAVERAALRSDGRDLPPVTVSIGVVELTDHPSASALFGAGDAALYSAKKNGRNRVERAE